MVLNIVRYDCGCIGIHGFAKTLLLKPCDGGREDPTLNPHWRNMLDKTHEPVSDVVAHDLLDELTDLVHLGHRFKDLKRLLDFPIK